MTSIYHKATTQSDLIYSQRRGETRMITMLTENTIELAHDITTVLIGGLAIDILRHRAR